MNQLLSLLQIIIVTIILHSLLTSRNYHVEASEYRITRVERVQAVAPNNNHYLRANGQHHKRQHIEKNEYVRAEPVAAPLHSNIHNESYHHHHHQQRYPNTHSNPRENDQQQQQQQQHSNHKHDSTEHHHHHKRQHNTNDTPGHKNPKNDLRKEDAMKTTANDVLAKEGPATTNVNHNGSNKNNITKEARD
jgi:hypothetical protein